jgi:single-strand DNA-binding protein
MKMNRNYVRLYGYAGHDPIIKFSADGTKRAIIRVATHYPVKKTDDFMPKAYTTVWHWVVAWGIKADFAERNFVKSSKILVEGSLVYRSYIDKAGNKVNVTDIRAESLENLDR